MQKFPTLQGATGLVSPPVLHPLVFNSPFLFLQLLSLCSHTEEHHLCTYSTGYDEGFK